ncbi:MAG: phytanoyl-CoA dioxygenase family protein [Planctomycetota bacterium]
MPWMRFLDRISLTRRRAGFRSRFGGTWVDRPDAEAELERRARDRGWSEARRACFASFIRDGFAILPERIPEERLAALRAEIERLADEPGPLLAETGGRRRPLDRSWRDGSEKLLDLHAVSGAARELVFHPPLAEFLSSLFDSPPLAFQSLVFARGSEQRPHRDTAYVVVNRPLEFAASWIALEDIRPGSGELVYFPGSHRLPESLFGRGRRNWNRERDGDEAERRFLDELVRQCGAAGLEPATFRPRAGEILVWHADLVHGGLPIRDAAATRSSLVTHCCPLDARPYYFSYRRRHRAIGRHHDAAGRLLGAFSSAWYAIEE